MSRERGGVGASGLSRCRNVVNGEKRGKAGEEEDLGDVRGGEKTTKAFKVPGTRLNEAKCSEARYSVRGPSKSRPGECSRPRVVESSVPSMTVHSLHRTSVGGSFG